MSHYKPYPAYRDSCVEWIGQVPEHWRVTPLKVIADTVNGATPESGKPEYWDGDIAWYTPTDIDNEVAAELGAPRRYITQAGYESCAVKLSPPGSVVLSTRAPIGSVGTTTIPSTINQGCRTLIPAQDVPTNYLASTLVAAREELRLRGNGTTFQELSTEGLRSLRVPMPPRSECVSIASGLDRETTRIDALITNKTRFIELLKEKRQALITHAVTKGLTADVPMRESGVEWLGQIPSHWEVSKLGYVASEQGGKTPSTENAEYWDGDVPWVSPKDMKVSVISDSIDHITSLAVDECGMAMIPKNAVLVVVRGMILAHSFPVAETGRPVTINQDMKALVPIQDMLSTYLRLVLQSAKSYVVSVLVAEAAHGTRVLRTDIWKQLPVVFPPVAEQRLIIEHIEAVSLSYDRLASKTQRSIDLLKERRAAFITAAVTGQIDLRESA